MAEEQEDQTTYKVGLNHEEQYSIWPADRENALGGKMPARVAQRKSVLRTSRKSGHASAQP